MSGARRIRQTHRWVSILFTIVVGAIFIALGFGQAPAQWVYYLPLMPLALLVLSGVYMFFLPYYSSLREHRRGGAAGVGKP